MSTWEFGIYFKNEMNVGKVMVYCKTYQLESMLLALDLDSTLSGEEQLVEVDLAAFKNWLKSRSRSKLGLRAGSRVDTKSHGPD